MIDVKKLEELGYKLKEDYYFDEIHHSAVYQKDSDYLILDYDLCDKDTGVFFDYSKYCEMQNSWMTKSMPSGSI